MKLLILAGPASSGKTAVARQIISNLKDRFKISYLKIDVVKAFEAEELNREFGIETKVVYSGDLCPDHAEVMVMSDAIKWSMGNGSNLLIVESAGLCLRCSPYLTQGLGVAVLSCISGMNTPLKMRPLISLADIIVVTKVDLSSQAEKEVFVEKIKQAADHVKIFETNALQGTGFNRFIPNIEKKPDIDVQNEKLELKGNPPVGTCTICVGKKQIGWQNHFGVVRKLDGSLAEFLYKGE